MGEGEHGVVPTNDDVGCDEEDVENPYIYEYVRIDHALPPWLNTMIFSYYPDHPDLHPELGFPALQVGLVYMREHKYEC